MEFLCIFHEHRSCNKHFLTLFVDIEIWMHINFSMPCNNYVELEELLPPTQSSLIWSKIAKIFDCQYFQVHNIIS